MRSPILPLLAVAFAAANVAGCATKKYVSREVGGVNQKVDNLSTDLEQTQQRVGRNETRIDDVHQQAQSGIVDARSSAERAMTRAQDAERAARGKLVYTVTLSDDQVKFPFNRAEISDEGKQVIDQAIAPIKAENRGVFIEIEGHTDATGPAEYNKILGEERARAVRNYLHEEEGIALGRIEVISYGETRPVADNKTSQNRAQNRRVVINVLE